jgi:hypothetical protein
LLATDRVYNGRDGYSENYSVWLKEMKDQTDLQTNTKETLKQSNQLGAGAHVYNPNYLGG